MEPDENETVIFTTCFTTTVVLARRRPAEFEFVILNSTTVDTEDIGFNVSTLTIPVGFNGSYTECASAVVIGDSLVEEDEVLLVGIRPLSDRDSVLFSELIFDIIDNDGNYY